MIILEALGKNILIRGRKENGERYEKIIRNFRPYFYVPDELGDYISLFGTKLKKVILNHPGEVRKEREKYKETFEADVIYINRYLIDNFDKIPKEPIRICFFDLEVDNSDGFPNPKEAKNEIISISAYDSFLKRYYCFIIKNDKMKNEKYKILKMPDGKKEKVRMIITDNETELLKKFISFIKAKDFDILTAYNGDNFDFPYLFKRIKKPEILSPIKYFDKRPKGRIWLDFMKAYKKLLTHELESDKLDYVAKHELGVGKIERNENIRRMWLNEPEHLILYNVVDVWCLVEIEKKKGIFEYFDTVRRISFSDWYDVFYNSRVIGFYSLKYAKRLGLVLPTAKPVENAESIPGARIIQPKPGIHENIAVGDVRSLYPTAILTCNLSPETKDENGEIDVDDVCFRKEPIGFVPGLIKELWDLRQEWKKKRNEYEIGSDEYKKWDNLQTVAKFLLNSVYGYLLYQKSRLFDFEVGKSVTYFGRRANMWMENKIKELGYEVIGGDTDSIFFKLKSKDLDKQIKEAESVINYVNSTLDEFCEKEFGDSSYNKMYIEFEKIYKRIFFASDGNEAIKKRYAGFLVYKDGKILEPPKFDIVGFDAKRSDSSRISKQLQKDVLKMILTGKEKEYIIKEIKKIRKKIERGEIEPEEIAIPKGMNKPIYSFEKPSAHIRGAIYYNKFCNGNIKQEKVKYIYIKKVPPGFPFTDVISFPDNFPSGFKPDWNRMAKLNVDEKLKSIFTGMGWDINELEGGKQLTLFSETLKNNKGDGKKWW